MRTRSLLAAALVLATLGAPAQADPPSDAQFLPIGCYLVAFNETTQLLTPANTFTGLAVGAAIGFAPTLGHNPVRPKVSCVVKVGGNPVSSTTPFLDGQVPVVGLTLGQVTFSADFNSSAPSEDVHLCTNVTTVDNHGQEIVWPETCELAAQTTVPGQPLIDLLSPLCMVPGGPIVCAFLDALKVYLYTHLPLP